MIRCGAGSSQGRGGGRRVWLMILLRWRCPLSQISKLVSKRSWGYWFPTCQAPCWGHLSHSLWLSLYIIPVPVWVARVVQYLLQLQGTLGSVPRNTWTGCGGACLWAGGRSRKIQSGSSRSSSVSLDCADLRISLVIIPTSKLSQDGTASAEHLKVRLRPVLLQTRPPLPCLIARSLLHHPF